MRQIKHSAILFLIFLLFGCSDLIVLSSLPPSDFTYFDSSADVTYNNFFNNNINSFKYLAPIEEYIIEDNKALPKGLFFNNLTGAIFGRPVEITDGVQEYTIKAVNSFGYSKSTIKIRVNFGPNPPVQPNYPTEVQTFIVGQSKTIINDIGDITGAYNACYDVCEPPLPAGLFFGDNKNIQGTPTSKIPQATYKITISNGDGYVTGYVTIEIQ